MLKLLCVLLLSGVAGGTVIDVGSMWLDAERIKARRLAGEGLPSWVKCELRTRGAK